MTDRQYITHLKEARRINKRIFFCIKDFDARNVVSGAFMMLMDTEKEYIEDEFYKAIYSFIANVKYGNIKKDPVLYSNYLKSINDREAKYRKTAHDWYIKHLLSKHYSMEYINTHPDLVSEKKKEILNLRNNNNIPVENELPPIPNNVIDLSLIDIKYKGYAISIDDGSFYSCKHIQKSAIMFTNSWNLLSKRKNGRQIRFNINGVKTQIGTKKLVQIAKSIVRV